MAKKHVSRMRDDMVALQSMLRDLDDLIERVVLEGLPKRKRKKSLLASLITPDIFTPYADPRRAKSLMFDFAERDARVRLPPTWGTLAPKRKPKSRVVTTRKGKKLWRAAKELQS